MDESVCPEYDPQIHDPYSVTLVKNRLYALRTLLQHASNQNENENENGAADDADKISDTSAVAATSLRADRDGKAMAPCFAPPRIMGSFWPYFVDNTVLGEVYQKTAEVETEEDWEGYLSGPILPPNISPPSGG